MKTRILALIILLAVAAVAVAVENNKDAQPVPIDPNIIKARLSAKSTPKTDDSIVAVIGDYKITEKDIAVKLEPTLAKMANQVPPQFLEQYKSQLRKNVLEQLVIEHLLMTEAKQRKIIVSDKEIEDETNKQLATQQLNIDDFKELLKAYGTSYEEQQAQLRSKLTFTRLIDQELAGKEKLATVDDAKKFYDENLEKFKTPAQTRTSHILLSIESTDANTNPVLVKTAALAKAQDLLKQLKEGADFAKLAQENSTCPSAKDGGDLRFTAKGSLSPEYENAAATLKLGQVSDVVETQFGYHIIKLTGVQDANTTSFDQAKTDIMENLDNMQKGQLVQEYIAKLLTNAKITYTNPADTVQIPENTPPPPAAPAPAETKTSSEPKTCSSKVCDKKSTEEKAPTTK